MAAAIALALFAVFVALWLVLPLRERQVAGAPDQRKR
jgi:hypothetical protein